MASGRSVEPIGISTSWNGPGGDHARLLDEVQALGLRRIEAYAHFTPGQLRELHEAAQARGMEVASLHSPCPVPVDERGGRIMLGDWLASTVERERMLAVDAAKRTIDAAAEIGARAIVIHLGNTGVATRKVAIFDTIAREGRNSQAHRDLRALALREREAAKGPHLEVAMGSIRALGEHAVGTSVVLGLECRDAYHEIPDLDEMAEMLAACEGLPVGYWHDAGHGAKLEYAGFLEHEELLRRYGNRLVGMHIHDTLRERDHIAPGQGTTDFGMLAQYLRPDTIRTLELHAVATPAQITWGLDMLAELQVFGVREGLLIEA